MADVDHDPELGAAPHERAAGVGQPRAVSGEEGEMNGTPWANAFGRLHTGPIERSPAAYQRSSASSAGVDRLGALQVQHRHRRPVVVGSSAIEIRDDRATRTKPVALERQQPPRGGARVGGGHRVLHRRRGLELDHAVVTRHPDLARAPVRGREHREDRPADAAGAHPRQVEVAAVAPASEQRMVLARQRVVVPVENRHHGATRTP